MALAPRLGLLGALALASGAALAWAPSLSTLGLGLALFLSLLLPATPLCALAVLLTLSPLRALVATEAPFALPLPIGETLLLLYFGIWIASRVLSRKRILALAPSPLLFALLALVAVFAIGASTSVSPSGWLREWLKWVAIAALVWQLTLAVDADWRWLVFAVVIAAVANALVGLYIFFGGSGAEHLVILGRFFRAFGAFGQPNPFGGFMGLALPLALAGALDRLCAVWSRWRRGTAIAPGDLLGLAASVGAACLLGAALVASWSRGAWLGFAISSLAIIVLMPRRLAHGLAMAVALLALVWALWVAGLLPDAIVARVTTAAGDLVAISDARGIDFTPENFAVVERLAHWQAAVDMATEHPILGVGLGGYEVAYERYRLINWEAALGHAHNLYLNMLAETGILGAGAYLLFWLIVFRLSWSLRRHPDRGARMMGVGLFGCWTYIAVHSLFDNLFVNNLFLHIGVLLGVSAILHRQISRSLRLD